MQNNTGMDVIRDNNKPCIVEDIELNGLKTSIEHILKWQTNALNIYIYIYTAYNVVLNVLYRQNKTKRSKCDNF